MTQNDLPQTIVYTLHQISDKEDDSQLKQHILRTLAKFYTTSDSVMNFAKYEKNEHMVKVILESLIATCKSGQPHLIALALDCFYEVFNEAHFDRLLAESGAIDSMEAGLPQLEQLFNANKKHYDKSDLAEIENALANVAAFVAYKREEFSKL